MFLAAVIALVVLATAAMGWAWRDKHAPLPALMAVLAAVLITGALGWYSDTEGRERDAAADRRRAADQLYVVQTDAYQLELAAFAECLARVENRDDLRGQFLGFYQLLEVAFEDNATVLGLVDQGRALLEEQSPSYPSGTCPENPPTPPTPPTED